MPVSEIMRHDVISVTPAETVSHAMRLMTRQRARHMPVVDHGKLAALRIAWDAGNGATGPALEKLTARLPGEHHLLFTEVDGNFPNHHPDPTEEKNLADVNGRVARKRRKSS